MPAMLLATLPLTGSHTYLVAVHKMMLLLLWQSLMTVLLPVANVMMTSCHSTEWPCPTKSSSC
jgi:hypothetical protein